MSFAFLGWRTVVGPALTPLYGARQGGRLSSSCSFLPATTTQSAARMLSPDRRGAVAAAAQADPSYAHPHARDKLFTVEPEGQVFGTRPNAAGLR